MLKLLSIIIFINILKGNVLIYQKDFTINKDIKSWIELKKENLTKQKFDYSCGSASLSTILKYFYNINITEKDILDDIKKSKEKNKKEKFNYSLSFHDIAQYSNKKGFKAIGLAVNLDSLAKLKIPAILFVKIRKNSHFTVYKNMDNNYVYLADSIIGNTKVNLSKFKEMFYQRKNSKYSGKILIILPNTKILNINYNFLNIKKNSNFIYKNIRNSISESK